MQWTDKKLHAFTCLPLTKFWPKRNITGFIDVWKEILAGGGANCRSLELLQIVSNQEDIECKVIHPIVSEASDDLCEGTESSLNVILLTYNLLMILI